MFVRSELLDKYINDAENVLSFLKSNNKVETIKEVSARIKDVHNIKYNANCVEFTIRTVILTIDELECFVSQYKNDELVFAKFDSLSLVEIPIHSLTSINMDFVSLRVDNAYQEILESKYAKYINKDTPKNEKKADIFDFSNYVFEQMSLEFL